MTAHPSPTLVSWEAVARIEKLLSLSSSPAKVEGNYILIIFSYTLWPSRRRDNIQHIPFCVISNRQHTMSDSGDSVKARKKRFDSNPSDASHHPLSDLRKSREYNRNAQRLFSKFKGLCQGEIWHGWPTLQDKGEKSISRNLRQLAESELPLIQKSWTIYVERSTNCKSKMTTWGRLDLNEPLRFPIWNLVLLHTLPARSRLTRHITVMG